jgi:hypothetical protein
MSHRVVIAVPGAPSVIQNGIASAGPKGLRERSGRVKTTVTVADNFE